MMASIDIPFEAFRGRSRPRQPPSPGAHAAGRAGARSQRCGLRRHRPILAKSSCRQGEDLMLDTKTTRVLPFGAHKAAFYGVQWTRDLFDPVKSHRPRRLGQHDSGGQTL